MSGINSVKQSSAVQNLQTDSLLCHYFIVNITAMNAKFNRQ